MLKHGSVSKIGSDTIDVAGRKQDVFRLSVYNKRTGKIEKCAFVSKETTLPVRWFDYTNGKLFAITNWQNIKTNATIPDTLFDIRKSP
jgi:outer membrane lipoprotein-sorting protein